MKKASRKEKIMMAAICGVSGWGAIFAGVMMTAVSASVVKELIKKGEK